MSMLWAGAVIDAVTTHKQGPAGKESDEMNALFYGGKFPEIMYDGAFYGWTRIGVGRQTDQQTNDRVRSRVVGTKERKRRKLKY